MDSKQEIYTSCDELPIYNFVKIAVRDELRFLNVDRLNFIVTDDHKNAWTEILQEYTGLSKDNKQFQILDLLKVITKSNLTLDLVQNIVDFLANDFDQEMITILRSLGFLYKYDPYSDTYDSDLRKTVSQAKSIIVKKNIAEKELEGLKSEGKEKKATEQDYISLMVALSKFQGYHIDWKKTSVSEYVETLNSFVKNAK